MIGFLAGVMAGVFDGGCFVDVSGVGYRVLCSSRTLAGLPATSEPARLWTHVYVREDALALYGFASETEQHMFEALLGVAGVGPKVALAMCSAFTPDAFKRALVTDDSAALATVPGIGRKTAQRIVLELKERLELPDLEVVGSRPDVAAQARAALQSLGYSPSEARAALVDLEIDPDLRVEDLVRLALRSLAGGGAGSDGAEVVAVERSGS